MSKRYEVRLPGEIIATVISQLPRDASYMRTLWSCCLLSHEWYDNAIGPLYASPRLSNKNFDKFARTICPPVHSINRQIGLEALVRDLNMGALAYESSNSLTARMIRRTRINLRSFHAPAVSFSISCLAPLSKCMQLQRLDLSRDFYDLEMAQLLNAIKALPIVSLSLPRSAMRRYCRLYPRSPSGSRWPERLQRLVINDFWLPQDITYWSELIESWPDSLVSVAFEDCSSWDSFQQLYHGRLVSQNIKHVKIGLRRGAGLFPVNVLVNIFPNIRTLAIPAPRTMMEPAILPEDVMPDVYNSVLEVVTLGEVPGLVKISPFLETDLLLELAETNPKLFKINVPDQYLDIGADMSDTNLEKIEDLLSSRAGSKEESGVYLT